MDYSSRPFTSIKSFLFLVFPCFVFRYKVFMGNSSVWKSIFRVLPFFSDLRTTNTFSSAREHAYTIPLYGLFLPCTIWQKPRVPMKNSGVLKIERYHVKTDSWGWDTQKQSCVRNKFLLAYRVWFKFFDKVVKWFLTCNVISWFEALYGSL